MVEHRLDDRCQWPEQQMIARSEQRRQRAVFRSRVKIASAENDGGKPSHGARHQRRATCQPYFELAAALLMNAAKARGQGRRVVRDHEIAATEYVDDA